MKLANVLSVVNQIEKTKFLNFLDDVCTEAAEKDKKIEAKLKSLDGQIKQASSKEINELFNIVYPFFRQSVESKLALLGGDANLLARIIARDGNCVASRTWVEQLFLKEWEEIDAYSKEIISELKKVKKSKFSVGKVYLNCFKVAFTNDIANNQEAKISFDERTVLNELS